MTPEQLREHAKEWDNDGGFSVAEVFRAHAAALEELARVKDDLIISQHCHKKQVSRAERAEAELSRLRAPAGGALTS